MVASTSAGGSAGARETLIAAPQVAFADLAGALAAMGWRLESESAGPPLLAGEPEHVALAHRSGCALHYTFNPVVRLRVLQFRGADSDLRRAEVARRVPSLGLKDLRELLESVDIKSILLGLFAAEEIAAIELVDRAAALALRTDPRIACAAARVRDSLLSGLALARLPVSFSELGSPEFRKQTLRCVLQACRESNATIDRILCSALRDTDPEVRVTAVLAAAKLDAENLIPDLRAADIPTSTCAGADPRERLLYERLRQTAIGYLSAGGSAGDQGEQKRRRFRDAVSGALDVQDDATLLLYSLTTPVPSCEQPALLPEAVDPCDGAYRLRRSGLVLRWVAPVPHWLGEEGGRAPLPPNPIRQVRPAVGFFITETVVEWSDANRCWPSAASPSADAFLCSYDEAVRLCSRLASLDGIELVLPTADQWEMAARGPDGRRYPWGNSLRQGEPLQPSPWLIRNMVGHAREWTRDRDNQGRHIACGGPKTLVCARRELVSGDARRAQCAVRAVLTCAGR